VDSVRGPLRREFVCIVLAGLETGVVAGLAALAWYVLSSLTVGRSPWTVPVALAGVLVRPGYAGAAWETSAAAGAALQVAGGGVCGVLFAIAARLVRTSRHILFLGLLFGLGWYYALQFLAASRTGVSYGAASSLGWTVLAGHLLFGVLLSLYPRFLSEVSASLDQGG
jgi:hypothetical protein